MNAEIVEMVEQAGPYVTAALGAYGGAVLVRAQDAAVDGTAHVGRRVLHAVWQRLGGRDRQALEQAVQDAADDPQDADAAAALRQQMKRALREDPELVKELAGLLPAVPPDTVTITASGTRSIAARTIGTAITGDHATVKNGPVQTRPMQNGPMQNGPVENGPVENGPVENGSVEERAEIGPAEGVAGGNGTGGYGTGGNGTGGNGTEETRTEEGFAESPTAQDGTPEK